MNYYLNKLMTYHQVHQMEREGFSIQRIAGYLGMDWRTAKRLLSLDEQQYLLEQEIPTRRKSSLSMYEEFVKDKLLRKRSLRPIVKLVGKNGFQYLEWFFRLYFQPDGCLLG